MAIGLLDVIDPDPAEPDFSPRSDGLPGDLDDAESTAANFFMQLTVSKPLARCMLPRAIDPIIDALGPQLLATVIRLTPWPFFK